MNEETKVDTYIAETRLGVARENVTVLVDLLINGNNFNISAEKLAKINSEAAEVLLTNISILNEVKNLK